MNKLSTERRARILACLCEGNSVRATSRLVGCDKETVLKLLAEIGPACKAYQDQVLRNLTCKRLEVDEVWSFCYAKEKNVPQDRKGQFGFGDIWTFTAICADTKLIPCWYVGRRDYESATSFMQDLASRLANRVQLTTDGHKMYLQAVEDAFGGEIDFAQLHKIYGTSNEPETRYSPAQCVGATKRLVNGHPKQAHVSTSYIERSNLTIRMANRRFTRLTNGFSKKVEHHAASISLFSMYYNFCRVHQTLRVTPAMEAGIADHIWEISEIVALLA